MHIESFAPPKVSVSAMVLLGAVGLLVVVVIAGLVFRTTTPAAPSSSTPAAAPTPTPTLPGHPFRTPTGNAGGRWDIVASRWTSEGLSARIKIMVDEGPITYSFFAFANTGTDVVDPTPGPDTPELTRGTLADGESIEGWVFFPTPRGDTTITLATAAGRQMSALVVKG